MKDTREHGVANDYSIQAIQWYCRPKRHMPFTKQLTSALAMDLSKKKHLFSTKKTVYLYPFTDCAGGQMECSGQQSVDTCEQCSDCADTRSHDDAQRKLAHFSHFFLCVLL